MCVHNGKAPQKWSDPIWHGTCGSARESAGTRHTQSSRVGSGEKLPPGGPASAPPILLCCLHFSGILLWYIDISLYFFSSRKNQLSVSNKLEGDLDVLQLGRYPGASVLAPQGPAVFIWSVWEVVGGGAFCWLGRGSFSPTWPWEGGSGPESRAGFSLFWLMSKSIFHCPSHLEKYRNLHF